MRSTLSGVAGMIVLVTFGWSCRESPATPPSGRTLQWDASSNEDVTEYRIYVASESGQYDFESPHAVVRAPETEWTIEGLEPGDYFAVITSVTPTEESPPSAEIQFRVSGDPDG